MTFQTWLEGFGRSEQAQRLYRRELLALPQKRGLPFPAPASAAPVDMADVLRWVPNSVFAMGLTPLNNPKVGKVSKGKTA